MATKKMDPMNSEVVDFRALEAMGFEALLDKLESVVHSLESGELPLENALALYEEGVGVVRAAKSRLDGMEKRLEQIAEDGKTSPLALSVQGSAQGSPAGSSQGPPATTRKSGATE